MAYIKLTELEDAIYKILQNINTEEYKNLRQQIEKLQAYKNLDLKTQGVNTNVETLLQIYKKIQTIALEFRKILQKTFPDIETYEKIGYALYYKDKIFYLDSLPMPDEENFNKNLFTVTKEGLNLNLREVEQDLAKLINNTIKLNMIKLFENHYKQMLNQVSEEYNKHHTTIKLGEHGASFNRGHVAEAHEYHLLEHHTKIYKETLQLSNEKPNEQLITTFKDRYKKQIDELKDYTEKKKPRWQHMIEAYGTQRGTVAGDVYNLQVKQIANEVGSGSTRNLAKFANLQAGIKNFISILDDMSNPKRLRKKASSIAKYLSEPINRQINMIEQVAAKEFIEEEFKEFFDMPNTPVKYVNI